MNQKVMSRKNPFPVIGYQGSDFFCDREKETELLSENLRSGLNSTLISLRRMGKTALVYHVFDKIVKEKEAYCLYVDLYPTRSISDLTRQLATAVMNVLPQKKRAGKRFISFLKGLRPVITYDPLTGRPEVRFEYAAAAEYEVTLLALLSFLNELDNRVFIALDEFQEIGSYREENSEALLRSMIQPLNNIHFVFSGSNRHMMREIFHNTQRPFFAATRIMSLSPIPTDSYGRFIAGQFASHGKGIDVEAVEFVLEWTRCHTYYTQSVCNTLFTRAAKHVDLQAAKTLCGEILEEQEKVFLQYRNLLTAGQWHLLMAVAKEGRVYQPQSGEFLSKHSLGIPASAKRALESLLTKEMIYEEIDDRGRYYSVYDLFLSRWLERQ